MGLRTKAIQRLVQLNEAVFFYPKLKRFYKGAFRDKTPNILDVGANKGQSIDFFLSIDPAATINAFEPNKKLFVRLQAKYKKNAGKIRLHNLGVSNLDGQLEFHENVLDETSTFEQLNFDSKYLEKKAKVLGVAKEKIIADSYKVDVMKLSGFLSEQTDTFFDVLKIDVEGHELQVLQGLFDAGLQKYPIRFIQLESHNDDMYLDRGQHQDIDKLLNENQFIKVAEIKHGFGDFAEIIYENKSEA
jgi:FkbM family methyltransferase